MAEAEMEEGSVAAENAGKPRKRRRLVKWFGGALAGIVALFVVAVAVLDSPIGHRFVTDQIAKVAPASGLRFKVGRIEGDLFGKSTLHDVVAYDPQGEFLMIPVVELDWRPLSWFTSGLDVRNLVARRGTLLRTPELLPGDPDAPILPDFDIRIDRFEIDNFTVAKGVVNDESHRVDLLAQADIRSGKVYLKADGKLGEKDSLHALIDAEPDGDTFDIDVDYRAPKGGVLAGLIGADAGYRAIVRGDGTWSNWDGLAYVQRDGARFASFKLSNTSGRYGIVGQVYPAPVLSGIPARALGSTVSLAAFGTLVDSEFDGEFALRSSGVDAGGNGVVHLADNNFQDFDLAVQLKNPDLLGDSLRLEGADAQLTLDGNFRDLTIDHKVQVARLVSGETQIADIVQQGTATYDGSRWTLPLDAGIARIVSGNEMVDPKLVNGKVTGTIAYTGSRLLSDDLAIRFPGANARLSLRGDLSNGAYALAGPVDVDGLKLDNIGTASGNAKILFKMADGVPWTLRANLAGRVGNVSNATLANLAGDPIRFKGSVGIGQEVPLVFRDFSLNASKLQLSLNGKVDGGRTTLTGSGRQADYGPFTVEAAITDAGPNAVLVFADPLPAAGLKDVRVALSPTEDGFRIETSGGSMLGPFDGVLGLVSPANGPTRIGIERLDVWKTSVSGDLVLGDAGVDGSLALSGGGLDGTIALSPRGGGQAFDIDLKARNAVFGGATDISIATADIEASGLLLDGNSTIQGNIRGQGLRYGSLFIGRIAASTKLRNGEGTVTASLAGRRGSRFNLQMAGDVASKRLALIARGDFAGKRITMPRRAVLVKQDDGGWQLQPTQLSFGGGIAIASGEFGGGATAIDLKLAKMPLSLVDIAVADVGLGGTISGIVNFRTNGSGVPVGSAKVQVKSLTRSGLVLTSRPVDLSLVMQLTENQAAMRAAFEDDGKRLGRVQGYVRNLPSSGALFQRLQAGDLFAQLRYRGPADALWRLAAIDAFDLTGPISVAANVNGSLADPRVRGTVASEKLRLQSSLSGTDVRDVKMRGTFDGATLRLTSFSGTAPNGGSVSGSGVVGLANMSAERGPRLDMRASAKNAQLLNANGLNATITGPLRIVSNGIGGTIAGRIRVDRASWRLGTTEEAASLPNIKTRDINVPADIAPGRAAGAPWRYLIDAKADSRIDVDGMGLDSEWAADIILRGTTDDPRIGGEARYVRGDYTFAGTRFELTRGRIEFDENVPIDPRIDVEAETNANGYDVTVNVAGNAMEPQITFSSNPALPEEEILSRLLFGDSITSLSATDALQLGAALASLRGGSGMDPINKLRSAIGLDRLRIVGADPALNQGTAVAVGKNIGRRFYVEIITDGKGYSATEVEFRITSWLSLLGSISTLGRDSVVAEVSKDY